MNGNDDIDQDAPETRDIGKLEGSIDPHAEDDVTEGEGDGLVFPGPGA